MPRAFVKPGGPDHERDVLARLEQMRAALSVLLGQPDDGRSARPASVSVSPALLAGLSKQMAVIDDDPRPLFDDVLSQVLSDVSFGDDDECRALHAEFGLVAPEPLPDLEPGAKVQANNYDGDLEVLPWPSVPDWLPAPGTAGHVPAAALNLPPDYSGRTVKVESWLASNPTLLPDSGFLECLQGVRAALPVSVHDDAAGADSELLDWAEEQAWRPLRSHPARASTDSPEPPAWMAKVLLGPVSNLIASTLRLPLDRPQRIAAVKQLRAWTIKQLRRIRPTTYAVKSGRTRDAKTNFWAALVTYLDEHAPARATKLGRRLAAELLVIELTNDKVTLGGEKRAWRDGCRGDADSPVPTPELIDRLKTNAKERETRVHERRRKRPGKDTSRRRRSRS